MFRADPRTLSQYEQEYKETLGKYGDYKNNSVYQSPYADKYASEMTDYYRLISANLPLETFMTEESPGLSEAVGKFDDVKAALNTIIDDWVENVE